MLCTYELENVMLALPGCKVPPVGLVFRKVSQEVSVLNCYPRLWDKKGIDYFSPHAQRIYFAKRV